MPTPTIKRRRAVWWMGWGAVHVLTGVVLTLLLAWGPLLIYQWSPQTYRWIAGGSTQARFFTHDGYPWRRDQDRVWSICSDEGQSGQATPDAPDRGMPGWHIGERIGLQKPDAANAVILRRSHCAGMPFRCLAMEDEIRWLAPGANSLLTSAYLFRDPTTTYPLPLRPYWPGLLGNIGLFALTFAALHLAIVKVRRWHKLRRRVCIHCGYSRVGIAAAAPCPECGAAVDA